MASLSLRRYQETAELTRQYPNVVIKDVEDAATGEKHDVPASFMYSAMGVAGEAGELVEKLKKVVRNKGGVLTEADKYSIGMEVGDCLWYLADICTCLGISLEEFAQLNLNKLVDRLDRDKICSEGDNR